MNVYRYIFAYGSPNPLESLDLLGLEVEMFTHEYTHLHVYMLISICFIDTPNMAESSHDLDKNST